MNTSDRQTWLDALRFSAGISMIGLHATSDFHGQPFPAFEPAERIVPMLLRAVVYTARTELFIIIALFLLLASLDARPRSYRNVVSRQAQKLLIPFLFWTIFFAGFNFVKAEAFGYSDFLWSEIRDPSRWVDHLLLGSVKYHMHFIPTLFLILLAYPLYRYAAKLPFLGILVLVGLAAKQQIDAYIWANQYNHDLLQYFVRLTKVASYIGYGLVAGTFLYLCQNPQRDIAQIIWTPLVLIGLLLFSVKLFATWRTINTGAWTFDYVPGYWADFLMPLVLFGVFLCLANQNWPDFFSIVAPYSFGLYLCHPIFMDLAEVGLSQFSPSPTLQVFAKFSFALISTSVFVFMISRSRLLAWTIGLGKRPQFARISKTNSVGDVR